MQYLLTEDEYKSLHGERDEDIETLEIENIHLRGAIDALIDGIDDINLISKAGRNTIVLQVPTNRIIGVIKKELERKFPSLKN